jgi:hypothetical protein
MSKLLLCCASLLLLSPISGDSEPRREYTLIVDGVEHDLEEGPARTIEIGGEDHRVQLVVKPYRTFERGGVSFRFPEHMMFAIDEEEPISWEFNGSDALIMLQEYEGMRENHVRSMLIAGIKSQYGDMQIREKSISETFGERTLTGTQLTAVMPEIEILQDAVDRGAPHTEEFVRMIGLLRETLVLKE